VIGSRWFAASLTILVLASGAQASALGVFGKKTKSDAQVKRLIETMNNDADEARRRAALADLIDVDPRQHPDVITALVAVLQKDSSPAVRAAAASAIGQYRIVYAVAGLALEAAAELDPSRAVRDSAQQALWEYHLAGYRSLRGVGGIAGQTVEPPIAARLPRQPIAPAAMNAVAPSIPPRALGGLPPLAPRPAATVPRPTAPIVALRPTVSPLALLRSLLPAKPAVKISERGVPALQAPTPEPPIAVPRALAIAPPPKSVSPHPEAEPIELPAIAAAPEDPVRVHSPTPSLRLRVPGAPGLPGPRVPTFR